jgi:ribokinase
MGRVVVLGSYNADLVARVEKFPKPGETLHAREFLRSHGGKGSNQAVAARRAGADVIFIGAVGNDAAGTSALEMWQREGIAADVVRSDASPTGLAMILVDDRGENQIVIVAGANAEPDARRGETAAATMAKGDIAVAQLETPLEATRAFFTAAHARGATTLLNAAPAQQLPPSLLAVTDMLIVNAHEARTVADAPGDEPAEANAGALAARAAQACVITLGGEGALLATRDGTLLRQPAAVVDVVDTTGAGDAFVGAFVAALAGGAAFAGALADGVAAGSLACTRPGAVDSLPNRRAIAAFRAALPAPQRL